MNLISKQRTCRGQLGLVSQHVTPCVINNTYYPVLGAFSDGSVKAFVLDTVTGIITCKRRGTYLAIGVSDMSAGKVAKVTYGMFKNGSLIPNAETPHDFTNAAQTSNISIAKLVVLQENDEIQVNIKSSVDNTDITVSTLMVVFSLQFD